MPETQEDRDGVFQSSVKDMQDSSERLARESTRFARGAVNGVTELWLGSARLLGDLALNWNDSFSQARDQANENTGEKRTGTEPIRQFIEFSGNITRDCSRTAGEFSKVLQSSVDAFTSVINEDQDKQPKPAAASKPATPPKV